jgi:hypothetical protein
MTYLWQIVEVIDDANDIMGPLWSFDSVPSTPVILSQPQNQQVWLGENAQFAITAKNPFIGQDTSVSYQWYAVSTGMPLADGMEFGGTMTATLDVLDCQADDEDGFFCRVTNTFGNTASVDTVSVSLLVKRLVHHWPLDGDPNDMIGDVDGTFMGAPVITAGKVDDAVLLGADQYIKLPVIDRPLIFTITAWTRNGSGGERHIFGWTADTEAGDKDAALIRYNNGNLLYGEFTPNAEWWRAVSTNGSGLDDNQFHLVAVTFDNFAVKLYIDGYLVQEGVLSAGSIPAAWTELSIGALGDRGYSFNGTIDDVRFYNYVLDRYEIADLYLTVEGGALCLDGYPTYDVTGDCVVNLDDLAALASEWLLDHRYVLP